MRERRCAQQQDIARSDWRQMEQELEMINEAEATLVSDRFTLQEQETQLILAAHSSEVKFEEAAHSSEVKFAEMEREVEEATAVRCKAMEQAVERRVLL